MFHNLNIDIRLQNSSRNISHRQSFSSATRKLLQHARYSKLVQDSLLVFAGNELLVSISLQTRLSLRRTSLLNGNRSSISVPGQRILNLLLKLRQCCWKVPLLRDLPKPPVGQVTKPLRKHRGLKLRQLIINMIIKRVCSFEIRLI
jgi:hypothetical protein